METLRKVLDNVGKSAEVLSSPDGARILVLPHGGRVLGLFAPGSGENFLWTNPALQAPDSARAFFESDQWCNSGGDRTWLAPEADFFLPRFPDTSVYFQPREADPGQYRLVRDAVPRNNTGSAIQLENRLTLRSHRFHEDLSLRIVKRVEPAMNPLRQEPEFVRFVGLKYAGYSLWSALELSGGPTRACVGLWQLLQLPPAGEMLIPTYTRTVPRVFFGSIPAGDLAVEDRLVSYTMRADGEQKIGVSALTVTGRAGCLYSSGAEWSLVVRNFTVNPSGIYADTPWDDLSGPGYAVQACNVNSRELGRFNELEYHAPAVGGETGLSRCEDVSQVWAFRGPKELIRSLAAALLGAEAPQGRPS